MPSTDSAQLKPETAAKARNSYINIIRRLNTQWELNLPLEYGNKATALEHGSSATALKQADAIDHDLARQCAEDIRILCDQDCQLDGVIADFKEANPLVSPEWVWKPSQEEGTLPKLSLTKSFQSTRREMPNKNRRALLSALHELLHDEAKLALDSDVYKRICGKLKHEHVSDVRPQGNQGRMLPHPARSAASVSSTANGAHDRASRTRRSAESTKRKPSRFESV